MSGPAVQFEYYFFPVGQGLFSSGTVAGPNRGQFHWVYDCGTTCSDKLVNTSLDRLRAGRANIPPNTDKIQLVTISHFDADHVNGLNRLLTGFRVGTLLLPYLPLWRRLLLAAEQNVSAADARFGWFLDPAGYVLSTEGSKGIDRILFVPGSTAEGPPPPAEGEPPGPREDREGPDAPPPELKYDEAAPPSAAADDPMLNGPAKGLLGFIPPDSVLTVAEYWEFVPYNDERQEPKQSDFDGKARRLAALLLNEKDEEERDKILEALKRLYSDNFGSSSEAKNVISLFLYCGAIARAWRPEICFVNRFADDRLPVWHERYRQVRYPNGTAHASGLLYTGDGYLNSCERFGAFHKHFDKGDRLGRTGVFQVMHHGARGNWHPGVADAVNPEFSIFSSHPRHKGFGHPHAEVLRDFWTYNPLQVDRQFGWLLNGVLIPR